MKWVHFSQIMHKQLLFGNFLLKKMSAIFFFKKDPLSIYKPKLLILARIITKYSTAA